MSSPLMSQIKNRRGQGGQASLEMTAFDDSSEVNTSISTTGSLDISKIQNSNAVSSQLNHLIQKVNDQKDEINKDISEQQEKTKDFEMYQQRLSSMMKNGIQKEKEFHELIETHSQKAMKSQAKKASLESELIQTQSSLRQIQDKANQIQEQIMISQRQFSEQQQHKSEIFSKTLSNKDKLISELQSQLSKAQAMFDKQMSLRLSAESEYKQKQELMMKMMDRLAQSKAMVQSKQKDPAKQAKVDALIKSNALAKEALDIEMDKLGDMKHELLDLKMRKEKFEQQKYDFEHNIDKLNADLEDKAYLEERLNKIERSTGDLKLQQDGMIQKIDKKGKKISGNSEASDDLDLLLTLIQMLNSYERASQDLFDQLRDIENMLHILIENTAQIECWHLNNKDKLIYTLGKQKGGSSTGGLGFLIKHALIEKKIDELKQQLLVLKENTQVQKGKIEEQLQKIQSKPADKVSRQELEVAININNEVNKEILTFKQSVGDYQTSFNHIKSEFEISQERVRQSYITEVLERIKIADDDNVEGADRVTKALIIVNNFEQEAEKYLKLIRNKDKKEEIRRLIQVGQKIKDDSNEVKANLQGRKNQLDKISKGTKDIDKMNLGKLIFILQDLRKLDNYIDNDKKDINDVERRAFDMDGLFKDLIMGVIKDLFNEMSQKASQRSKKIVSLKQRHQFLQDLLEKRRQVLYLIQSQLEDDDTELLTLYKTYEGILDQANSEEDQASGYLRQLLSSDERIQKSVSIISKENINLEHVNEQIDQLDSGESILKNCEQKLEDSTSKAKGLELQLAELELKIKLERINDCERAQKQTSDEHEKFKRLLDRLHTYLTVIDKDQNYMVDEFNDMEKKKESLSFKQEVDKKEREYTQLKVMKDKYYAQLTHQEKNYEEAQKNRDQVSSSEFLKMMRDSEKLREEIKKVYVTTSGPFNEELTACKEIVLRMVKKYKTKKEKFQECIDLRILRESDILQWRDRLLNMKDRIQMLEGQLSILGVSEEQEGAEIYKKFVHDIEILSQNTKNIEKQIQQFSNKISDESEDLNQMEVKIVKTLRLDEIWKILEQIGVQIEGYEREIEKFDKLQKQIENEVDAFMNKIRSSQLFDCEQRIKEVDETIEKLIKKLHETESEVSFFKQELQVAQSTQNLGDNKDKKFENRDQLVQKSEQFVQRVDSGQNQREKIELQLLKLKSQLGGLDKKNVSMNEIYSILNEAQTIGSTATIEIKKANDVQEELRQLNMQWKENNKQAGERVLAQNKAKELLRSNLEQLKNMRSKLINNNEKTNNFEILYKSMLGSEDYAPKKARVEKKMRRMAQMKSEMGKFQEDQRVLDDWENKVKDLNIDNIENMEQLNQIIKDSEKMAQTLAADVKDLQEMEQGLIKKRIKVADAEIRNVSQRRKQELQQVADSLQAEMKRMHDFEQALTKRQQESEKDNDFSPEKQQMVMQAQEQLRQQFAVFKNEFSNVEDEIRNITTDIDCRELETEEPLARLAKEIDKMQNKYVTIKALRSDLDKIQIDLTKKSSMLSSMDTENKLNQMLLEIEKDKEGLDGAKSLIGELIDISKNYNGYTSGNEDDEFFQVVGSGGMDMNKELLTLHKSFSDLTIEIQRVISMVEQKKAKSGGNMSSHEIEDLNDQIVKIEVKMVRYRKMGQEINAHSQQSFESVSQHDLENKIDRRGEELLELERIIIDILKDQTNVRERIQTEIDACQDDPLYVQYIIKLRELLVMIDSIESQIIPIKVSREDLLSQQRKLRGSISLDSRLRFRIHYRNIELKKSIQMYLKQISEIHTRVKTLFTSTNSVFNAKPKQQVAVPQYKFDPNDEVDKMFGFFMQKLGFNLKIQRLGGGYYMFGTKKIFCKIINGKLVVRVGGGYMGMEEFMVQYGPQEMEKLRQLNQAEEDAKSSKNAQGSGGLGLSLSVSSKVVKKVKGLDSPSSQRSLQSNDGGDKSVGGTSSGMQLSVSSVGPSSFLKNAKEKQNFANALEEAKKAFKEETVVGGGVDTKSSKVSNNAPSLSLSVSSTVTKKVVKGKKGI